jgi:hypothetical protein
VNGWPLLFTVSWLVTLSPSACSSGDDPGAVAAGAGGSAGDSSGGTSSVEDASASDVGAAGSAGISAQGGSSGAGGVSPVDGGETDGASGAAGGAVCMDASPDPTACTECVQTGTCAAEFDTCASNPDCPLYSDCLAECEDDACKQGCKDQFGGGPGDYERLQGCAYAGCHAVCLDPGCPWVTQEGSQCEACINENCCVECTAAATDGETMAGVFCIQACADQTCVSDCLQTYPAANDRLTTFIECREDLCGTECT